MYPRFHATKRYDLLEINITANNTATKFNIPDQPQLRTDQDADVVIQAIETFSIFDVALSPNNVAVASEVILQSTYLTLYIDGEESIYRVPMLQLHRITNTMNGSGVTIGATQEISKFKNLQVDWTKSYFSTPQPYGGGTFASFSFLLGVHYMKLPPGTMAQINKVELAQFCSVRAPQP
jgi:hypothetical protein